MNRSEETIGNDAQQNESTEDTSAHPMDAFLEEEAFGLDSPRRGEVRTGTIARITDSDILVDIGYKSEGLIPGRELERLSPEKREELVVGTEVTVYILRSGGTDGTILLSISRAEEEKDWLEAERLLKTKEAFEGVISGYNKGGLIVKLGHLRGFIPASQVSMARRWRADGDSAEQRWGKMVGEPIVSKVIEVERRRNRLILSERAAAREARDVLKERLIEELEIGEIRTGYIISLADFGAFVDIGGADGLVHTSEISWKRINHPRDILKVGQEVKVKVLGVDREQKRISLSMRELEADPWDTIINHYKEGQLVEGTVTKLTKFGAFASLKGVDDYELEGLVHISELSDRHIVHPREVVGESETLTLRVIKVDRKRRRIGLSLKKVDSPEYAELDWQAAMEELKSDEDEGPDEGISITPADESEVAESVEEAIEQVEGEAAIEAESPELEQEEASATEPAAEQPAAAQQPAAADSEVEPSLEAELAEQAPAVVAESEQPAVAEAEVDTATSELEVEPSPEAELADQASTTEGAVNDTALEADVVEEAPAEEEVEVVEAQEEEPRAETPDESVEETSEDIPEDEGEQEPGNDLPVQEVEQQPESELEAPEEIVEQEEQQPESELEAPEEIVEQEEQQPEAELEASEEIVEQEEQQPEAELEVPEEISEQQEPTSDEPDEDD